MRALLLLAAVLLTGFAYSQDSLKTQELDDVIVYATRANENTPTTYSEISKKEIENVNLGQDLPILLNLSSSLVTTSDAGAGVGYTGLRIRGSDATRINVTINGIPVNDSESHGVFWVNMPDFASSVDNIQIQRGVGTSTNGAAAFGATVNLQTNVPSRDAYAEVNNSFGSFNTRKHTLMYNTGLLNNNWSFESRLSKISSDGYIDRAESDLQSYFLSGGYYGDKTILKALVFGGKEVTYQSWWGTPQAVLENDRDGIEEVIANNGYSPEQAENIRTAGRTFNYYLYENEVDNYQQDHYQLHLSHMLTDELTVNIAGHYTYGRGYFEQFRDEDDFADYGLENVVLGDTTITSTDLIRRRWLDNDFYGTTFSLNYLKEDLDITLGGAWNKYDGDHFGEVIWAQYSSNSDIRYRYYDNVGLKTDFNVYLKTNYQLNDLNLFADLQVRKIDYETVGIDSDLRAIDTGDDYTFFNPKVGATYTLNESSNVYASFAIGNREPVRNDFVDAPGGVTPKHETLRNLEIGYRKFGQDFSFQANYYLMDYENQLVLTGELNDVGSSIRQNVPDSYRMGIELVGAYQFTDQLRWDANLTLSRNKIENFTEVLYNYGPAWDEFNVEETQYKDTDIAFSPNVIGGSQLTYTPFDGFEAALRSKYVGKQFLDNTSNDQRSIDPYFINDLRLSYNFSVSSIENVNISLLVNNILDVEYSSNGYTFGYAAGSFVVRENYLYPQAGRNFLAALNIRF
ncbi:TonB-dependent receptor [Ekhidna sp.]|jgi:iron complex outermembrane receptor protein|uniref:TonB-dependent receptor n=1 Tax=Ekhidna sp. TaxID=2608089 RepID=UPI0032EE54C4